MRSQQLPQPVEKVDGASPSATSGLRERVPLPNSAGSDPQLRVGRYIVGERIAAGGMATVHIGRLRGAAGFSRTVAIKRLLPQFASDPEFESLFMHEARLVARIQHPNVVATLDVLAEDGELILVMDYVPGETLSRLMQTAGEQSGGLPPPIALSIIRDALLGLHAAHEARDRRGEALDIVHRDISPQNLMVGSDGLARVLDFGIAKAASSVEVTRQGLVRGKTAYMAPEQIFSEPITRRADIYAAGIVLWEMLVGERLFPGGVRRELMLGEPSIVARPSARGAPTDEKLDAIVLRALAAEDAQRFETALEMAEQLSASFEIASREQVADWVRETAHEALSKRAALVARTESADVSLLPPSTQRQVEPTAEVGAPSVDAPQRDITPAVPVAGSRRFRRALWLLVALLSAGVGVSAALAVRSGPTPSASSVAPIPPPPAELAPTSAPLAGGASALEKSSVRPLNNESDPVPAENPVDEADSAPAAAGAATVGGGRAAHKPRSGRASARPPAKVKANCSPPYTVDDAGRRHYKVECF